MKKLLLVGAFALLGGAAQAQEGLKLGGHIGVPYLMQAMYLHLH